MVNPIARSLMAKYDKRTDAICRNRSTNKSTSNGIEYSYFSNLDGLNNCRKRAKLIKKCGDQRSYIDFLEEHKDH